MRGKTSRASHHAPRIPYPACLASHILALIIHLVLYILALKMSRLAHLGSHSSMPGMPRVRATRQQQHLLISCLSCPEFINPKLSTSSVGVGPYRTSHPAPRIPYPCQCLPCRALHTVPSMTCLSYVASRASNSMSGTPLTRANLSPSSNITVHCFASRCEGTGERSASPAGRGISRLEIDNAENKSACLDLMRGAATNLNFRYQESNISQSQVSTPR